MTAEEVYALRTGADAARYLCVDVRAPHEYAEGHLVDARNVPLDTIDTVTLPQDKTIIVYCAGGRRSRAACAALCARGYTCINLDGGISAWMAAGLPTICVAP